MLLGYQRAAAVVVLLVACKRTKPPAATTVTLDGMRVEIMLPDDMHLDAKASDETLGAVSFVRDKDHPPIGAPKQIVSAFLTGTRNVVVPSSLSVAVAQGRDDYCKHASRCDELAREELAGGGFMVTLENDNSVVAYALKPGTSGRAFLCGAQAYAPFTTAGEKTWLDAPAEVKTARAIVEGICRSTKVP
jgi:hypothetical protein